MKEQIEPLDEKERVEFLPYFPTDFERAEKGFKKFNEVFEKNEVLKKVANKDKFFKSKILYCSTGLMPETGFYSGGGFEELDTDEERGELKNIYEKEFGLKTLHWQRSNEKEKWDHSIFNPASVEKVIKNCPIPNLFPEEAKNNPMEWILENPLEWVDDADPKHKARFGVLSGYPPHASAVYGEYAKVIELFIDKVLANKERKDYYKYANSPRTTRELPANLDKKLNEFVENKTITPSQLNLMKKYFRNDGELDFFGDGFFDEDEKYFDNIKIIFDKLGIKENQ